MKYLIVIDTIFIIISYLFLIIFLLLFDDTTDWYQNPIEISCRFPANSKFQYKRFSILSNMHYAKRRSIAERVQKITQDEILLTANRVPYLKKVRCIYCLIFNVRFKSNIVRLQKLSRIHWSSEGIDDLR